MNEAIFNRWRPWVWGQGES